MDADDENEGNDEQQEIRQAIPSELIPDQALPRRKRKAVQGEAPAKLYKRTPRVGIQKRTGSTRRKRDAVERGIEKERRLSIYSKYLKDATLISVNSWRKKAHRRYGHVAPKRKFQEKGANLQLAQSR